MKLTFLNFEMMFEQSFQNLSLTQVTQVKKHTNWSQGTNKHEELLERCHKAGGGNTAYIHKGLITNETQSCEKRGGKTWQEDEDETKKLSK